MQKRGEMRCRKGVKFGVKREKNCAINYVCLKQTDRTTFGHPISNAPESETGVFDIFCLLSLVGLYHHFHHGGSKVQGSIGRNGRHPEIILSGCGQICNLKIGSGRIAYCCPFLFCFR